MATSEPVYQLVSGAGSAATVAAFGSATKPTAAPVPLDEVGELSASGPVAASEDKVASSATLLAISRVVRFVLLKNKHEVIEENPFEKDKVSWHR